MPIALNASEIDNLAEDALNAACLLIQKKLGVTSGDTAGLFFSDETVKNSLKEYIQHELSLMRVAE